MPATSTRRTQAGEQFVAVTKATKENAQAYLRNNNYNLDAALNQYFAETQDNGANKAAQATQATQAAAKAQLNQMFDELIPEEEKERDKSGDVVNPEIGPLQSMDYIQRLGVNIVSYEQFVVLEIVQAETLGTITRKGFVDGWAQVVAESNGKVTCDWSSQKRLVRSRINRTLTDPAFYKVYYDFAFQIGKEPSQKAINMALAIGLWEGLFDPTTHPWRSANVNWFEAWADYLKEKFGVVTVNEAKQEEIEYKRSVSKDLWAQTRLFAAKTMEDETLGFWSEEQAWPGLIDEFVLWCREKGIAGAKVGETMEVEE